MQRSIEFFGHGITPLQQPRVQVGMRRIFRHLGRRRSNIRVLPEVQFRIRLRPNANGSGETGLTRHEARVLYEDFRLEVLQILPDALEHCFIVGAQVYLPHVSQKLKIQFR